MKDRKYFIRELRRQEESAKKVEVPPGEEVTATQVLVPILRLVFQTLLYLLERDGKHEG